MERIFADGRNEEQVQEADGEGKKGAVTGNNYLLSWEKRLHVKFVRDVSEVAERSWQ